MASNQLQLPYTGWAFVPGCGGCSAEGGDFLPEAYDVLVQLHSYNATFLVKCGHPHRQCSFFLFTIRWPTIRHWRERQ